MKSYLSLPQRWGGLAIALLVVGLASSPDALGQNRNVSFLHGIGSNNSAWSGAVTNLNSQFRINPRNQSYSSNQTIPGIASIDGDNLIQTNSVVVAHSMGGLVAREKVRQAGTGRVSALITTGTPHRGAPIANNTGAGYAGPLFANWITDLGIGWWYWLGGNGGQASAIAQVVAGPVINNLIQQTVGTVHYPSFNDLKVNSSFINQVNNPNASRPYNLPAAHYAIYGTEDWNSPWRLYGSSQGDDRIGISRLNYYKGVYNYYFWVSLDYANYYFGRYVATGDFYYYQRYVQFSYAAGGFLFGYQSLRTFHDYEWASLIGSPIVNGQIQVHDGIVPAVSQAPFFIAPTRWLRAGSTNHLEETRIEPGPDGQNGINAVRLAFRKNDINIAYR